MRKYESDVLLMSALSISAGLYHNEYITETFCSVYRLDSQIARDMRITRGLWKVSKLV